ncbi:unnamed protein product [Rhizopus stolonifer]
MYSEADYQYKFWSYIFGLFLGRKQDVVLQWGDTVSDSCKKAGQQFKLDLRIVMIQDGENTVDGCNGEMAKKATNMLIDLRKIYHDNNSSDENDIENILTKANQKKERLNYNAWITEATFEKEHDEDDEDGNGDGDGDDATRPFHCETVEANLKAKKFITKLLESSVREALNLSLSKKPEESTKVEEKVALKKRTHRIVIKGAEEEEEFQTKKRRMFNKDEPKKEPEKKKIPEKEPENVQIPEKEPEEGPIKKSQSTEIHIEQEQSEQEQSE